MATTAQEIADRFHDDGLCFTDASGWELADVCEAQGVRSWSPEHSAERYQFADGSAIIIQGGGWDLQHPDCTCGWCWAGDEAACVQCECGEAMGEKCQWSGRASDTVLVEWMPVCLRASHEAAGNAGVYPHNGAIRIRCERGCADRVRSGDEEWSSIVDE